MDDKKFEELLKSSFDDMKPEQLDQIGEIKMSKKNIFGMVATGLATAAAIGLVATGAWIVKGNIGVGKDNNKEDNINTAQSSVQTTEEGTNEEVKNETVTKDDESDYGSLYPWLVNIWELDVEKTESENKGLDLWEVFGSALFENGSELKLMQDQSFIYSVGVGTYGEGTYTISEDEKTVSTTGKYEIGDHEENRDMEFTVKNVDGVTYLVTEYEDEAYDFEMFWSVPDDIELFAGDTIEYSAMDDETWLNEINNKYEGFYIQSPLSLSLYVDDDNTVRFLNQYYVGKNGNVNGELPDTAYGESVEKYERTNDDETKSTCIVSIYTTFSHPADSITDSKVITVSSFKDLENITVDDVYDENDESAEDYIDDRRNYNFTIVYTGLKLGYSDTDSQSIVCYCDDETDEVDSQKFPNETDVTVCENINAYCTPDQMETILSGLQIPYYDDEN